MGTLKALVVVLLAVGACSGTTKVTIWETDPAGKPKMATVRTEEMPSERFVEMRQQGLFTAAYAWNCAGTAWNEDIFGGEAKAYHPAFNGECLGLGAGNQDTMAVSLDHVELIHWANGASLDNNVGMWVYKTHDWPGSISVTRAAWYDNLTLGGGCVPYAGGGTACFENKPAGSLGVWSPTTGAKASSFVLNRQCGSPPTNCQ